MQPVFQGTTQQGLEDRVVALGKKPVMSTEPLIALLQELAADREALSRWSGDSEQVDRFRLRLLETCEAAADHLGWLSPTEVARLVDKTPETPTVTVQSI